MLQYLLENWAEAHANLPLTLEGNTTVLHQALYKAAFVMVSACEEEKTSKAEDERVE